MDSAWRTAFIRWGAYDYDAAAASRRRDTSQGLDESGSLGRHGESKLDCSIAETHYAYLNGGCPANSRSGLCPKRPLSFLQSGRPAKPRFCAMEFYEAVVGELTLPARKGQSSRSSNSQVRLPCFLGSGHWICALRSRHLTGSKAAGTAIGDDVGMRFERCVKEFTCRSNGQNLAQAAGRTLASRIKRGAAQL